MAIAPAQNDVLEMEHRKAASQVTKFFRATSQRFGLHGFVFADAPELAQAPYGEQSKCYLQSWLPVNSAVSLRPVERDRYGRIVAEVFSEGMKVNLNLLEVGHAVVSGGYVSTCEVSDYWDAEAISRAGGLVFWLTPNPEMLWDSSRR